MNGLECLKAELVKRGYTKQQSESKIVVGVLDVLSGADGEYSDMAKIADEVKELQRIKANLWSEVGYYEKRVNELRAAHEAILKDLNDKADNRYNETIEYIERFLKSIAECETQEGRDALKIAQMFVNTCDVDTKYDNTAFIIGLASILARGAVQPIEELRKINKKIPRLSVESNPGTEYGGFGKSAKCYGIKSSTTIGYEF